MNNAGKWALAIGGVLLGGWLIFHKKKVAPPEEVQPSAGELTLHIYGPDGSLIASGDHSRIAGLPTSIVEGIGGYTARVFVTNTSIYTGTTVKAPFAFAVSCVVAVGGLIINSPTVKSVALAAGATDIPVDFPFDVSYGVSGSGSAQANLYHPVTGTIYKGPITLSFTVTAAGVTPSGGITW